MRSRNIRQLDKQKKMSHIFEDLDELHEICDGSLSRVVMNLMFDFDNRFIGSLVSNEDDAPNVGHNGSTV